jgi:hypothetical protein
MARRSVVRMNVAGLKSQWPFDAQDKPRATSLARSSLVQEARYRAGSQAQDGYSGVSNRGQPPGDGFTDD